MATVYFVRKLDDMTAEKTKETINDAAQFAQQQRTARPIPQPGTADDGDGGAVAIETQAEGEVDGIEETGGPPTCTSLLVHDIQTAAR